MCLSCLVHFAFCSWGGFPPGAGGTFTQMRGGDKGARLFCFDPRQSWPFVCPLLIPTARVFTNTPHTHHRRRRAVWPCRPGRRLWGRWGGAKTSMRARPPVLCWFESSFDHRNATISLASTVAIDPAGSPLQLQSSFTLCLLQGSFQANGAGLARSILWHGQANIIGLSCFWGRKRTGSGGGLVGGAGGAPGSGEAAGKEGVDVKWPSLCMVSSRRDPTCLEEGFCVRSPFGSLASQQVSYVLHGGTESRVGIARERFGGEMGDLEEAGVSKSKYKTKPKQDSFSNMHFVSLSFVSFLCFPQKWGIAVDPFLLLLPMVQSLFLSPSLRSVVLLPVLALPHSFSLRSCMSFGLYPLGLLGLLGLLCSMCGTRPM